LDFVVVEVLPSSNNCSNFLETNIAKQHVLTDLIEIDWNYKNKNNPEAEKGIE